MTGQFAGAVATDLDASRRHLGNRAATVGLLMRNTVNLGVALIALADPDTSARTTGEWLLAILAVWSLYRLLTRSRGIGWLGVDYLLVLAVCASIPVLVPDPGFHTSIPRPRRSPERRWSASRSPCRRIAAS